MRCKLLLNKFLIAFFLIGMFHSSVNAVDLAEAPLGDSKRQSLMEWENDFASGEVIDKRRGLPSWSVTDVTLGGVGPDIQVVRSFGKSTESISVMSSWTLETPRIYIATGAWAEVMGSLESGSGICSDPALMSLEISVSNVSDDGAAYWAGVKLKLPNSDNQTLQRKGADGNQLFPADANYITHNGWLAKCIVTSDRGRLDGFKVTSPNGDTYIFDIVTHTPGSAPNGLVGGGITLFVSSITDKHGNAVTYQYERMGPTLERFRKKFDDYPSHGTNVYVPEIKFTAYPYLKSITGSDNRLVEFNYTIDQMTPGDSHESFPLLTRIVVTPDVSSSAQQIFNYVYSAESFYNSSYLNSSSPNYFPHMFHMYGRNLRKNLILVDLPGDLEWKYEYNGPYAGVIWEGGVRLSSNYDLTEDTNFNAISKITMPSTKEIEYQYKVIEENIFGNNRYGVSGEATYALNKITSGNYERLFTYGYFYSTTINNIRHIGNGNFIKKETSKFKRYSCNKISWCDYKYPLLPWDHGLLQQTIVSGIGGNATTFTDYKWKLGDFKLGVPIQHEISPFSNINLTTRMYSSDFHPIQLDEIRVNDKYKTVYAYDEFSNVVAKKDYNLDLLVRHFDYTYDLTRTGSNISTSNWRPNLLTSEAEHGKLAHLTKAYNENGDLIKVEQNGITIENEYYPNGLLWKRTTGVGAESQMVTFSDYYRGIARLESYPLGKTITKGINPMGSISWIQDGNGSRTTYEYDELQRLSSISQPERENITVNWMTPLHLKATQGNHIEETIFNTSGMPLSFSSVDTNTNSRRSKYYKYDSLDRLIFETYELDPEQELKKYNAGIKLHEAGVWYTYDSQNRITSVRDVGWLPLIEGTEFGISEYPPTSGRVTSICYDGHCGFPEDSVPDVCYLGRPCKTYPSHLSFKSNYGQITTLPGGEQISSSYQVYGASPVKYLVSISEGDVSGSEVITSYVRNNFGDLLSAKKGNITREYEYKDGTRLLEKEIHPEFGEITYEYDSLGNVSLKTFGDQSYIYYDYDNLGRLSHKRFSDDSPALNFEYDLNDNILKATRDSVVWDYQYNQNNQINIATLSVKESKFNLSYDYDSLGNTISIGYPSGYEIELMPNTFGQPTQVGNYVNDIKYHGSGEPKLFTYQNGISYSLTKDNSALPVSLTFGGTLGGFEYVFDSNRRIEQKENILTGVSEVYGYDGLNQLTSVIGNNPRNYSYDSLGNIENVTGNKDISFQLNPIKNILTTHSVNGVDKTIEYDGRGNIIRNGSKNFNFGVDGLLHSIGGISYEYDAFGNRVSLNSSSEDLMFVYSENGTLMHREDVKNKTLNDYMYINDKLVAKTHYRKL